MSTEFIVGTVITVALALLGGTAGLIRVMLQSRLDEILTELSELSDDVQDLKIRVAVLEERDKK